MNHAIIQAERDKPLRAPADPTKGAVLEGRSRGARSSRRQDFATAPLVIALHPDQLEIRRPAISHKRGQV